MCSMTARPRQRWIATLLWTVSITLAVVAIQWSPTQGPTRFDAVVVAAKTRAKTQAGNRAAAWGETREGSAFACYLAATAALPEDLYAIGLTREQLTDMSWALRDGRICKLRLSWQTALQLVGDGAHSLDAMPHSQRAIRWTDLSSVLRYEVALRLHEQRWDEAVELWIDSCTFQLDHGRWIDFDAWPDDHLRGLDRGAYQKLATGLSRLDIRLRLPTDFRGLLAVNALEMLEGRLPTEWDWGQIVEAWEWGFDPAARHLADFDELLEQAAALEPTAATGLAREAQWRSFSRATSFCAGGYAGIVGRLARRKEKTTRQTLTGVRLIQLALAFHQRVTLPNLIDPFTGDPIRIMLDGDSASFCGTEGNPPLMRSAERQ